MRGGRRDGEKGVMGEWREEWREEVEEEEGKKEREKWGTKASEREGRTSPTHGASPSLPPSSCAIFFSSEEECGSAADKFPTVGDWK